MFTTLPQTPQETAAYLAGDTVSPAEADALVRRFIDSTGKTTAADGCVITPNRYALQGHLDVAEAFHTWAKADGEILAATGTGDASRDATARALATMRRREADAKRDAQALRAENLRLRQEASAPQYVPINSAHPDWERFWSEAAENADNEGYCSEYDRMAELMGGTPRTRDFSATVSVTLSVTVPFSGREDDSDEMVDADAVASALLETFGGDRYGLARHLRYSGDFSIESVEEA